MIPKNQVYLDCSHSIFEKRKQASDDLKTVCLQFLGGETLSLDIGPTDKLLMSYCELKQVDDLSKLQDN